MNSFEWYREDAYEEARQRVVLQNLIACNSKAYHPAVRPLGVWLTNQFDLFEDVEKMEQFHKNKEHNMEQNAVAPEAKKTRKRCDINIVVGNVVIGTATTMREAARVAAEAGYRASLGSVHSQLKHPDSKRKTEVRFVYAE